MLKINYIQLTLLAASFLGGCIAVEDEAEDDMFDAQEAAVQLDNAASPGVEPTAEASAALDSWDEQMYTDDSFPGGRVRFKAYGDIVEVCDIQADGKSVHIYYNGWHFSVGGNGNCETYRKSNGYDLPERSTPYKFRICLNGNEWCDEAWWQNNN